MLEVYFSLAFKFLSCAVLWKGHVFPRNAIDCIQIDLHWHCCLSNQATVAEWHFQQQKCGKNKTSSWHVVQCQSCSLWWQRNRLSHFCTKLTFQVITFIH